MPDETAKEGGKRLCCGRLGRWVNTPNLNRVQTLSAVTLDGPCRASGLYPQHSVTNSLKP